MRIHSHDTIDREIADAYAVHGGAPTAQHDGWSQHVNGFLTPRRPRGDSNATMEDHQTVPISSLTPDVVDSSAKAIRAVVTLLWPYSSATRSSSLLLADPDFRLRRSKGQVRVFLQGAAAQAVAEGKVGIGDEVLLGLEGAQWQEDRSTDEAISTPGKNVDWQLVYRRRIVCRVNREGQLLAHVDVDQRGASPQKTFEVQDFATPEAKPFARFPHSTPALLWKRGRLSSDALIFSPYDPFADDGARQRKRARHSWNNVESWKLSDRAPSPEKGMELYGNESESSEPSVGEAAPTQIRRPYHTAASDGSPIRQSIIASPKRFNLRPNDSQAASELIEATGYTSLGSVAPLSHQDVQTATTEGRSRPDDADVNAVEAAAAERRRFRVFQDEVSALSVIRKSISKEAAQPQARPSASQKADHTDFRRSEPAIEQVGVDGDGHADQTVHASVQDASPPEPAAASTPVRQAAGIQAELIVLSSSSEDEDSSADEDSAHRQHEQAPIGLVAPGEEALSQRSPTTMMPPPTPPTLLLRKASDDVKPGGDLSGSAPRTPELRGVASPTLPLPSPFPVADEGAASSFLEARPPKAPEPTQIAAPKTIKATLAEEKNTAKLKVPHSRDRKSRSSSSSSFRRESGPFSDHVRPARGFGLDGTDTGAEEAVFDSPELQPIKRDIPGLRTLESLGEAAVGLEPEQPPTDLDKTFTDLADRNNDGLIALQSEGQGTAAHDDLSSWAPGEWLQSSRDMVDDTAFRLDLGLSQESASLPHELKADKEIHSPPATASTSTQARTTMLSTSHGKTNPFEIIDLDKDEDEADAPSSQITQEEQPTASQVTSAAPFPSHTEDLGRNGVSIEAHPSLQLTPPPTAPFITADAKAVESTPEKPYDAPSTNGFGGDGQFDGILPPTPSQTQQRIASSPSAQRVTLPERDDQVPRLSDAASPWFTPPRNGVKTSKVERVTRNRSRPTDREDSPEQSSAPTQPDSETIFIPTSELEASPVAQAKARLFDISKHIAYQPAGTQTRSKDTFRSKPSDASPMGLRTALSYYTPLHPAALRSFLNNPSAHEATVDVMAVVSSPPTAAKRADKGPRDWHELLSVATPSTLAASSEWPNGQVKVQCFMRGASGRALLPKADPGDVILLRDFSVVSQNGQLGLLNRSRSCAWCVFRWRDASEGSSPDENDSNSDGDAASWPWQEECLGTPVEIGNQERHEAKRLRRWWDGLVASEAENATD